MMVDNVEGKCCLLDIIQLPTLTIYDDPVYKSPELAAFSTICFIIQKCVCRVEDGYSSKALMRQHGFRPEVLGATM